MSGYPDDVPEVIPQSVRSRAYFVKRRYVEYKEELTAGEPGRMPVERARPIADELARGDLLSLLGRHGDRAFRVQLDFEESHRVEHTGLDAKPAESAQERA